MNRLFLGMAFLLCLLSACAKNDISIEQALKTYVESKDAKIGVAVVMDDGDVFGIDVDNPYPMLSVMKFPLALVVADEVRKRGMTFADTLSVSKEELHTNTYSPMLTKYPATENHRITIAELLDFSLRSSDNNACDILMDFVGGAERVDAYVKKLGINGINIKWNENDMHVDISRCYENSSTPRAMAALFDWFDRCSDDECTRHIKRLLETCDTGKGRLVKPFETTNVVVGHKTGTGDSVNNRIIAVNDAGYVHASSGKRYAIAVFVSDSSYSMEETEAIVSDVSRMVGVYCQAIIQK